MRFVVKGRLIGLNEYTNACRTNPYKASSLKKQQQAIVKQGILSSLSNDSPNPSKYPCEVNIVWYEPNKRRDIDNVQFATKFILDAMVEMQVIPNDNQKYINKINNTVCVDKENPRIEVVLGED